MPPTGWPVLADATARAQHVALGRAERRHLLDQIPVAARRHILGGRVFRQIQGEAAHEAPVRAIQLDGRRQTVPGELCLRPHEKRPIGCRRRRYRRSWPRIRAATASNRSDRASPADAGWRSLRAGSPPADRTRWRQGVPWPRSRRRGARDTSRRPGSAGPAAARQAGRPGTLAACGREAGASAAAQAPTAATAMNSGPSGCGADSHRARPTTISTPASQAITAAAVSVADRGRRHMTVARRMTMAALQITAA